MRVRDFETRDLPACLDVFDSNVPLFFKPHEREQLIADLPLIDHYLVIEDDAAGIAGCGGYAVRKGATTADLCWGMVRRDVHRTGLGRLLLEQRLQRIKRDPAITAVALNTSQHTRGFYERYGFVTFQVIPEGYAPGLDRCEMLLTLQGASKSR